MPILTLLLAASLVGCKSFQTVPNPSGDAVLFQDLKPDSSPGERADLVFEKFHAPVEVIRSEDKGVVTFDFRAHGATLDQEVYVSADDGFSIKKLGEETFDPPLTLLKSPMKSGDSWTWAGSLTSGVEHHAEGAVSTKGDRLKLPDGSSEDAVLSQVKLAIDGGAKTPAERKLSFWFIKGKGVIKREMSGGSNRQPLEPQ